MCLCGTLFFLFALREELGRLALLGWGRWEDLLRPSHPGLLNFNSTCVAIRCVRILKTVGWLAATCTKVWQEPVGKAHYVILGSHTCKANPLFSFPHSAGAWRVWWGWKKSLESIKTSSSWSFFLWESLGRLSSSLSHWCRSWWKCKTSTTQSNTEPQWVDFFLTKKGLYHEQVIYSMYYRKRKTQCA